MAAVAVVSLTWPWLPGTSGHYPRSWLTDEVSTLSREYVCDELFRRRP